jgi:hypothetical protein
MSGTKPSWRGVRRTAVRLPSLFLSSFLEPFAASSIYLSPTSVSADTVTECTTSIQVALLSTDCEGLHSGCSEGDTEV